MSMAVPVTETLTDELTKAWNLVKVFDLGQQRRLNDKDALLDLCERISKLCSAILHATADTDPLAGTIQGAAFEGGNDSRIGSAVDDAVSVLRTTLAPAIRKGNLSEYERTNAETALALLSRLVGTTVGSIRRKVFADLTEISQASPTLLIGIAEDIATARPDA